MPTPAVRLSGPELEEFMRTHFTAIDTSVFRVEAVEPMRLRMRLDPREEHLRPGGTVSGPTLMMLADTATYLALLAMIGPAALAVTANLNIHFLRKPAPAPVLAEAHLLRLGRRLAVAEVAMRTDSEDELVASATVTYTIPGGTKPPRAGDGLGGTDR